MCSPARPILRYREALGEDDRADPGRALSRRLSEAGRRGARGANTATRCKDSRKREWLPRRARKARSTMMMAMIRDDLAALNVRHDVFFSERSLHAKAMRSGRRRPSSGCARSGYVYRRPAAAAEGRAGRGLGGSRADAVPLDRVRRRRRPAAEEVGRQLHLFRLRHRLSQVEVRARLPRHDRRLGRRPRRLRQAHAGGREGGQRRQGASSTSRSSSS